MSFTIFQSEKTPFQAIKISRSKSRKVHFFLKGSIHGFGPKMSIFPPFFQAIQHRKMSLTIFQNEKTPFQAIKKRSTKGRKIDIFPKGLIHGFGLKMAIFPTFFLFNIGLENVFYDILERKNAFLLYKKRSSKSRKIDIFQWIWSMELVQKWTFFQLFFFRQYRPRKCLLRYSRTKKRLSRL